MTPNASPPAMIDIYEVKGIEEKLKSKSVAAWISVQWKPILAELMATSMLVLFGCMSNIPIDGLTDQSPLYSPIGFGLTVMFNVQIFGHVSGCYMNPAVTLGSVIAGNTSIPLGLCFFAAQFLGANIGYGLLVSLAHTDVLGNAICVTMPHENLSGLQAVMVELILTGTLVFLCCALWDPVNQNAQDSAPIKFGLAIIGMSVAGNPLTGASTNPTRSLAPVLWTGIWTSHWVYWVGPFMGSAIVATFYKVVFLKHGMKNSE